MHVSLLMPPQPCRPAGRFLPEHPVLHFSQPFVVRYKKCIYIVIWITHLLQYSVSTKQSAEKYFKYSKISWRDLRLNYLKKTKHEIPRRFVAMAWGCKIVPILNPTFFIHNFFSTFYQNLLCWLLHCKSGLTLWSGKMNWWIKRVMRGNR
jgi:hypothetical protein